MQFKKIILLNINLSNVVLNKKYFVLLLFIKFKIFYFKIILYYILKQNI